MIYDHIDNWTRYAGLGSGIVEGLRFLQSATVNLAAGRHSLSGEDYANVDLYTTKQVNEVGYEAHRKYVDIQFLLEGEERVKVRPIEGLACTMPYDAACDVAFFADDGTVATEVTIGKGYFVILFPNDAHEPQLCTDTPRPVKKVVVKVCLSDEPMVTMSPTQNG